MDAGKAETQSTGASAAQSSGTPSRESPEALGVVLVLFWFMYSLIPVLASWFNVFNLVLDLSLSHLFVTQYH